MRNKIFVVALLILIISCFIPLITYVFGLDTGGIQTTNIMIPFFLFSLFIAYELIVVLIKCLRTIFSKKEFVYKSKVHKILYYLSLIIFTIITPIVDMYFNSSFPDYFVASSDQWRPAIAHSFEPVIYSLGIFAIVCFWISLLKHKSLSPIGKVLVNLGMIQGLILGIVVSIQVAPLYSALMFFPLAFPLLVPLIGSLLLLMQLKTNHVSFMEDIKSKKQLPSFLKKLQKKGFTDIGIGFLLLFPFYLIIEMFLILFKQKPDALILAFTETCSFTLSQYPCNYVSFNHYLCTVAAKGHPELVKPLRKGIRHDSIILVNRQLLIANAFENWFEEKMPRIHQVIRKMYDRTGLPISKLITNKWLSDITYILMKPLEWFFLAWLYTFDRKPENRIHSQYLPK